jgi:hypothetical protein
VIQQFSRVIWTVLLLVLWNSGRYGANALLLREIYNDHRRHQSGGRLRSSPRCKNCSRSNLRDTDV